MPKNLDLIPTLLWPHSQQNLTKKESHLDVYFLRCYCCIAWLLMFPFEMFPFAAEIAFFFELFGLNRALEHWANAKTEIGRAKPLPNSYLDLILTQWWGSTICDWTPVGTVSVDTFNGSNTHPSSIWQPFCEPIPSRTWPMVAPVETVQCPQ